MILSDITLMGESDLIKGGNPLIGPASIDLTLGSDFLVVDDEKNVKKIVGPNKELIDLNIIELGQKVVYKKINRDEIMIPPNHFVLATTAEVVKIPKDMCGIVMGRSSVARAGLQIECAGFIDPGFEGQITLELQNQNHNHAVVIKKGQRLCQIVMFKLDRECVNPYQGKYQGQQGVTESKMEKDNERTSETSD